MDPLPQASVLTFGNLTASALSLSVALSIPFLSTVAKTHLAGASDLSSRGPSGRRGKLQRRRRFKPKKNIFGGAWAAIYLIMGLASWLVWRQGGLWAQATPLCLYLLQLGVNLFAWPPIFVGGHRRRYAVADSAALLGVSLVTMASFYVASPAAGFLMLPYLGWTCFATTLINCSLWDNNPAVVKSAHKFAQVKPQDTPDMSRANSGAYIRNKAAPADLGRGDFNEMSSEAGSEIHYSNRPILGEGQVHAETGGWNKQPEANHAWGQQQQQPQQQPYQQQQGWQQSQPWSQTAAAQAQPVTTTPFAESGLHRRSATDTDRDRRVTRRTTDEELDRFATHTDSGHLIMPPQFEKPEQKGNSGLFAKMSVNLQAAAEALTESAPGLPSPFERFSRSVNQFRGGPEEEGMQQEPLHEEEELDMSVKTDSIDIGYFADPGANGVKLRGPTYLEDKKKVETGDPICWLSSANLMEVAPTFHIARFLPSIKDSKAPFTFALQIMVPGKTNVSLTLSWSTDYDPMAAAEQPGAAKQGPKGDADSEAFAAFDRVMARFMEGDSEADVKRRHNTFKLIPRVTKGSWVIRNAVGSTPVLLGKKLTTKYFRGPNYFEVDIDVGSSKSAASVVGLVQGALKGLVIDMAITMEGHSKDELPEALLGAIRLQNLDLGKAAVLNLETGHITRSS